MFPYDLLSNLVANPNGLFKEVMCVVILGAVVVYLPETDNEHINQC